MNWLSLDAISTEIASGVACGKSRTVADGILHLRPFSVTVDGRLTFAGAPTIPIDAVPANRRELQCGDIIFNNTNSQELVGKSALLEATLRAAFSNHMTRIRVDKRRVEPGFVHRYLNHLYSGRYFEARATRWVSQAAFGTSQIKAIQIPVPPLDEQRRVVGVLNRAAEIRRRADAARVKARAIIPALFLDTFGDPATNPKRWPVVDIGGLVARIEGGWSPICGEGTPAHDEWGVLKLSAVKSVGFDANQAKPLPNLADARPELEVRDGDLLLTRKNTLDLVGTAAVVSGSPRRRMLPDTVFRLVPAGPDSFQPEYLCTLINLASFRPVIRQLASGSAASMPGISKGRLLRLKVQVPPILLQVIFAEQVQRLESLARHLDAAAVKADAIAAGLSAEVFGSPASPARRNAA